MKRTLRRSLSQAKPRDSVQAWLLSSTVLAAVLLVLLVAAACAPAPAPTPTPTKPPAPPPAPTKAPEATKPAAPTAAPAAVTPTPAALVIPPVPIGQPRRDRDWETDVDSLLLGRRTASSDLVGGPGGIAFKPKDCLRCHENAAGVEGQVFYGPQFKDFTKDQWKEMLSKPEAAGQVPIAKYDFIETHQKRADLLLSVFPEQQLKQNP